jgi:hypothetical protein
MAGLTANKIPKATDATHLEDSRISDDGSQIVVDGGTGVVLIGDAVGAGHNTTLLVQDGTRVVSLTSSESPSDTESYIKVDAQNKIAGIQTTGEAYIGDPNSYGNGTYIEVDDDAQLVKITNLPTADPHVAGALYTIAGTLHVSAG